MNIKLIKQYSKVADELIESYETKDFEAIDIVTSWEEEMNQFITKKELDIVYEFDYNDIRRLEIAKKVGKRINK